MMLRSKIHRATVTEVNLDYLGSISIDAALVNAAELSSYEQVQVVNINNGVRFTTYLIEAPAGSGQVALNGAAARLAQPGDVIIVLAYGSFDNREIEEHRPRIVFVDGSNELAPSIDLY